MFWTPLPDTAAERLLARIYEQPKKLSSVIITATRPTFYKRGEIIHLVDDHGTAMIVAAGDGELAARELFFLTGNAVDIRAANDAAGLAITADNALDYLKFFCSALKAGAHTFHVIESLEGLQLRTPRYAPSDLSMQVTELPDNTYAFEGYMEHGMRLFGAELLLSGDGMVRMLRDDPIGELERFSL